LQHSAYPLSFSSSKYAVGNNFKGQAQVSAANGTRAPRQNYRPSEEELVQQLKALPTTSMASSDSDVSDLMVVSPELIPSTGLLPPTNSPQQADEPLFEELRLPRQRGLTQTESMDIPSTADQDQVEATKRKQTSVPPNESPLNYVAALRRRTEGGRRSSRDLFEDLS